ncbi:MAG: nuclear transport factor 2 family protein [Asgard group archaeon]|nr:nuclear transport factor 2 family protein [Asgard group archaeon]
MESNFHKGIIYQFYEALTMKNLDKISELITDDSILLWGPYEFSGKDKILSWATELFELFPFISFKEKSIIVNDTTAKHEFMIAFLTSQGRKGWLPCESEYIFSSNKILQIKINLLHGFLAVTPDEVDRVKPQSAN